jgi:hypothetical protein
MILTRTLLMSFAIAWLACVSVAAQQRQTPAGPAGDRIKVCSLLPRAEVKKHLPWQPLLDKMPEEEIPVGATGSSCEYPSVGVQVLVFTPQFIEAAKKAGFAESVPGVGDEAYYRANPNGYAELYVRIGQRILTIQGNVPTGQKAEAVKPGVISLAKTYVPKLR